jgi:nitrite reductase/ring-hydroxylating ferredoxin subunit
VSLIAEASPRALCRLDDIPDGSRIVCATHGAEFGIEDGIYLRGPCLGGRLESVISEINDGGVLVPGDGGL